MKRKLLALSILSFGLTITAFASTQIVAATCCQEKAACCEKTTQPACCDGNKPVANPATAPKQ